MNNQEIIVVGGGAAGLMAAGRAAELGANVILIEHMSAVGRKLAITGKGRCNITNVASLPEFLKHFHPQGRFLRSAFSKFFSEELVEFFESKNVKTVVERGGRVFPKSGKALDVVEALREWVIEKGVSIRLNTKLEHVLTEDGSVTGASIYKVQRKKKKFSRQADSEEISCDALILTTGGASYPATGSTGDGYKVCKKFGHQIIPPRPALVPLEVKGIDGEMLTNLSLKNVNLTVWVDGKKIDEAFGEMEFTDFGVSGPVVLTLSRNIVELLHHQKSVTLNIDLKPALDHKKLDDRLIRDIQKNGKKQLKSLLKDILPRQLIPFCFQQLALDPDKSGNDIKAVERKKLRNWLKEIPLQVVNHRPFSEAIITSGGVSLKEVHPDTMQSRIVQGLYLAGEILDIQADTGGYNLQAAFSTGWLAGEVAATFSSQKRE